MGHFRKTNTKAMRGKPHTRRGKVQPFWLIPKDAEKLVDGRKKEKNISLG